MFVHQKRPISFGDFQAGAFSARRRIVQVLPGTPSSRAKRRLLL